MAEPTGNSLTAPQLRLDAALVKSPLTPKQRDQVWDIYHQTDPSTRRAALEEAGIPKSLYTGRGELAQSLGVGIPPSGQTDTAVGRGLDWAVKQGTDLLVGGVKGAADRAMSLGGLVQKIPGVSRAVDALYGQPGLSQAAFSDESPLRQDLQPTNTGEKLGYGAEKIGEFFIPVAGPVTKALGASRLAAKAPAIINNLPTIRRGLEGVTAGGLTLAQGGSPTAALVSGGLAAALPGTDKARKFASEAVKDSAESTVARALGANKEVAKQEAADIAPDILARGVGGTRRTMLTQAEGRVGEIGREIGAVVDAAAKQGSTVPVQDFLTALRQSRIKSQGNVSMATAIPGTESILSTLDELEQFAAGFGTAIPIDKAQAIKQVWANIVSKAGLYGPSAGAAPTDKAVAFAYKEGADAMRALISSESPTLAKLNKEFEFWKGLQDILVATKLRTQAQGGGLTATIAASGGGSIVGYATGSIPQALGGAAAVAAVTRIIQSPVFRTRVTGPLKMALADAISAGDQGKVLKAIANITSAFPSVLSRPAPVPAGGQISVTGLEVGN